MPKYKFPMYRRFLPEDAAFPSIAQYLRSIQAQFEVTAWSSVGGQQVKPTTTGLRELFHPCDTRAADKYGDTRLVWSKNDKPRIVVTLCVGADDWHIISLDLSHIEALPDLDFLRKSIETIKPAQAYLLEGGNVAALRARRDQTPRPPNWDRPWALHWFHYVDTIMLETVGGTSHALQTPVFHVEPFCDGLLFQITQEPLDSENPEHIATQLRAMEHLGITEFMGPPKEQKPLILRPRANWRKKRGGQQMPDGSVEDDN